MFNWFKRQEGAATVLGSNDSALVRFGAMCAEGGISRQRAAARQNLGRDPATDFAVRFATDGFVVGYAVGIVSRHVELNGRNVKELSMEHVVGELQQRIGPFFAPLGFLKAYRSGSQPLAAGILLGMREPGRN